MDYLRIIAVFLSATFKYSIVVFSSAKNRQRVVIVLSLRPGMLDKYLLSCLACENRTGLGCPGAGSIPLIAELPHTRRLEVST